MQITSPSPSDIFKAYYLRFHNDLLFSISVLNQPPKCILCPSGDYRNALTFDKERSRTTKRELKTFFFDPLWVGN